MISLLTFKAISLNHTKELLVTDLLKSSEIKSATQEVMCSCFSSSTTIGHRIYRMVEIMSKLMFIEMTKI